jgi:hypothetical protein
MSGDESTVDHYTVYASTDGQNLMPLQDEATGLNSLNLCSYSLPSDNYVFYVQAIGKPNLSNQISGAVQYTPHCAKGPGSKIKLSASPSSLTIDRGSSGTSRIVVLPESGRLKGPLAFSCSNLPANVSCDFSAASMTSDSTHAKAILTISTIDPVTAARNKHLEQPGTALYAGTLSFSLAGFVLVGGIGRKRLLRVLAVSTVIGSALLLSSCALGNKVGSNSSAAEATPGVYHLTITATSPETNASMVTTVTIR